MTDYISREAVKAVLNERYKIRTHMHDLESAAQLKSAELEIGDIPAADVRTVVRGKWIQTTQPMGWRDEDCAECSVCGEDFVLDEWAMDEFTNLMNFCPNCGADMREGS